MTRLPLGPTQKRRRLAHLVIDEIQEWISLGRFAAGDRLPTEDELTKQLGVSRTTLREAVGVLAHAGLLDVRQGDGTYVMATPIPGEPLDQRVRRAQILEVYEVRRVLEIASARFAAERRTSEDIARLRQRLADREAARAQGDQEAVASADVSFHLGVARAGGNALLVDLFRSFTGVLRETIAAVIEDPALTEDTAAIHARLIDAIERRDGDEAAAVTTELLEADARVLRQTLGRG